MTPLLTATDVAERLQVSRGYAYELMRKMHHVIIGRSIRVRGWRRAVRAALVGDEAYVRAFLEAEATRR